MKPHFIMMAAYNKWANDTLFAAANPVPKEDLNRDVGVFFGSLGHTLNHILVGDRIWMYRFTGTGDCPDALDVVLYDALTALRKARINEDKRIIDWISGLDDAAFQRDFTYRPITDPVEITQKLAPAVTHFFNHQTHHRGQAHAILSILGQTPPPLDLIYFLRKDVGAMYR